MSKEIQLQGRIHSIGPIIQISDNFNKLELVLITDIDTSYPQHVLVQFSNKNIDKINGHHVGHHVAISINIRGRLYIDKQGIEKAFTTIEGWSLTKIV